MQLVIKAAHRSRIGWDDEFAAMAARGDDALPDMERSGNWDESEWEW